MAIETRLTIRLDESKRKALQAKAKKEGKTATDVLTEFIDWYLGVSEKDKVVQLEERVAKVERIIEEKLGESFA